MSYYGYKKNVDFFVYVLSRYRQTPLYTFTSKSPRRTDVSIRTFTLVYVLYFGEFGKNKNLSGRFFIYV